jgi:cytochrome c peroxidase
LDSEIERVRSEVNFIEAEAIATGQPPTIPGNGVPAIEILGKLMNYDENMSVFKNEACVF